MDLHQVCTKEFVRNITATSIRIAILIAVVTTAAGVLSAQTTPPPLSQVGLPSNGVFSGGSIDSVQLNNGNLHVDIPLLHLPGIGMDTDIHYVYDNKVWTTVSWEEGEGSLGSVQRGVTVYSLRGLGMLQDPLSLVSVQETSGGIKYYCDPDGTGVPFPAEATFVSSIAFTDADGTYHYFPSLVGYPTSMNLSCGPYTWLPPGEYSNDTSGYVATTSSAGAVASIADKSGRLYLFSGTDEQPVYYPQMVEDSNGNRITSSTSSNGLIRTVTDTVGRTIKETTASGGSSTTIAYTDQNGTTQNITINYITVPLNLCSGMSCSGTASFYCAYYLESFGSGGEQTQEYECRPQIAYPNPPSSALLPSSIVLQNGDTYTFKYNSANMGEIQSLTLPTGAVISYTYGARDGTGRPVTTRTVTMPDGTQSVWTYNYVPPAGLNGAVGTTTVTDPDGNDTVYSCTVLLSGGYTSYSGSNPPPCYMTKEQIYSGSADSDQLIATKATNYSNYGGSGPSGEFLPTSEQFTWGVTGQTTETDTTWDSESGVNPFNVVTSFGNVVSKMIYDYGSVSGSHGPLLSNTQYTYLFQQNPAYLYANMLDQVGQVSVYNSASSLVSQTATAYDQFNQSAVRQSGLLPTSGTTQHDYAGYGTATTLRGLPTSITTSGPNTPSITTYIDYNDLGQKTVTVDGRMNPTTFTYGPQNAFVATTTTPTANGVSHVIQTDYAPNTGLLMDKYDQNHNETSYTYDERMRPLTVSDPDGGSTTFDYPSPNQVITTVTESPSPAKVATTNLDGLGRTISVSTAADAACGSLTVDTSYDLMGRVSTVSNPHCNSALPTDGWMQYAYDAVGRLTKKTNPDLSTQTLSYSGNAVDFYDEVENHWRRTYNAAGWLTQVLEPDGTTNSADAPSLETDYSYDTLGNLLRVDQWGGPYGFGNDHERTFAYDALSRLLSAYNPETGTVSYSYDNDGNVLTKTDNRGILTNYSYDTLNRLLSKTYSDSTPSVSYTYDQSSVSGSSNDIGQLTQTTVNAGSSILASTNTYAYDPMGRLLNEQQCTPANCGTSTYNLAYGYDQGGKPISVQFPSNAPTASASSGGPVTLGYTYDNADRLLTASSSWSDSTTHPATLLQVSSSSTLPGYGPMGLQNASLGVNAFTLTDAADQLRAYDDRGRAVMETNSTRSANNGTPSTGTITIAGAELSKSLFTIF